MTTPTARRAWRRTTDLTATVSMASGIAWRAAPGALVAQVSASLVTAGTAVTSAWLMKLVLDGVVDRAPAGRLLALAGALATVGLGAVVVPQLADYLRAEIDRRASVAAHDRLYQRVNRFVGLSRFEDPRFLDRLRLAGQGAQGVGALIEAGLGTVRSAATLAGFVGSLLVLNPTMTVVVLLAAIPALGAELALARRRSELLAEVSPIERRELFYSRLLNSVEAAKEIRLFQLGSFLRRRMIAERRSADRARQRVDRREAAVQSGLGLAGSAVAGGGLVWAVMSARAGQLTPGDVAMLVTAVAGVQGAMVGLVTALAQGHQRLLVFRHFRAVVRAAPDLPVPIRPEPTAPLRGDIELRNVWFRYSDEHPWILRGVSMRIPHGRAVALVGRNGAGKSTLVKLLCRFYDPTRGAITWDGIDLREMAPDALRQRIAATFQDYMAYDLTAAENVAVGELSTIDDPAWIESAARRAGVHHVLASLPDGYRTLLSRTFFSHVDGEDPRTGVVLSGGQWQRVALARAFVRRQPDLMILDEPSAGLDAEAEHEIHRELRSHRTGRTSLLISHRLGAIRDADLIVVLCDGRIVEQGGHDDLMAVDGTYARLFRLQSAGYQSSVAGSPVQVR